VRWKRVAVNVCEAVKLPRHIQREVHPLDQEQARRLLAAAQGSRLDCILTLALTTGMRLGEILALRWGEIDLEEQGLVFPNRNGGYFRRTRLYAIFKKLLQEADLPDMHFHDLRHSAATILLSMGVAAKVVQEILGHGNISTTMNIYGHVLPAMQRNAMDDMDDFFRGIT
jgi:integrase